MKLQLHTQILIGLLLGAAVGLVAHHWGYSGLVQTWLKPFGSAFIRLISMVVIPLVFASLVVGVAGVNDVGKLGRIGGKTLGYYLCTTAIAITFGLVLANVVRPGAGLSTEVKEQLLGASGEAEAQLASRLQRPDLVELLLGVIPKNPVQSLVEGNLLQIIFVALMLGLAMTMIPADKSRPLLAFFDGLNEAMIRLIHLIMKLAPLGVFALVASIIGQYGLGVLALLLKYALVVMVGLGLYMVMVFSLAVRLLGNISVGQFFRGIRPAQLIAFSTSSSSATLPVTMECAEENLAVSKEIASLTLPLGATINMDGTALYQGVSAVFIAQVYGLGLGIEQQLTIVLTATLASIGTAGAPGAGIITLAMILQSIGVPLEGIALILGVERILDMCRTVVNVTGDACCAVLVSTSETRHRKRGQEPFWRFR